LKDGEDRDETNDESRPPRRAVDRQNVTSCQVTLKVLKSEPRLVVAPVL